MVRQRVHIAIIANFDELRTLDVVAANNKMCTDMAAIIEGVTAKSSSCHLDTILAASVEPVHFELTFDHFYHFWLIVLSYQ